MEKKRVSKKVTATILSMSLLTVMAGATIEWNYAFLVYLLGLIALVMVWLWLPDEQLG